MQTPTRLLVIESYDEKGNEKWGISFSNHNPEEKDYFLMGSEDDAFRLKERLSSMFPPVSYDNPVEEDLVAIRKALVSVRHELSCMHGLIVTDKVELQKNPELNWQVDNIACSTEVDDAIKRLSHIESSFS